MSWEDGWTPSAALESGGFVDNSYDTPRWPETITQDIVTQRQDVGASTNDAWGGFLTKAIGTVLDYGIKKDAAKTGVALQMQARQPAQQFYAPAASVGAGGITVSPMLLIIGGLVALVVLKK